jgi:hypothetical protein
LWKAERVQLRAGHGDHFAAATGTTRHRGTATTRGDTAAETTRCTASPARRSKHDEQDETFHSATPTTSGT